MSKERLTERHGELAYCPRNIKCTSKCDDCDHMGKMMDKLAEYEDLEEQNLLLRLPCKVGDTVYVPYSRPKYIKEVKVIAFLFDGVNLHIQTDFVTFSLRDVNTTVFLTQSEAEEKLRELNKESEE